MATIPKQFLERDGVLDEEGQLPEGQSLTVDRLGKCAYVVRLVDDGQFPELSDCEVVERIAAQRLLHENAFGEPRHAD